MRIFKDKRERDTEKERQAEKERHIEKERQTHTHTQKQKKRETQMIATFLSYPYLYCCFNPIKSRKWNLPYKELLQRFTLPFSTHMNRNKLLLWKYSNKVPNSFI